jgi:hypothetical protein
MTHADAGAKIADWHFPPDHSQPQFSLTLLRLHRVNRMIGGLDDEGGRQRGRESLQGFANLPAPIGLIAAQEGRRTNHDV